MRLQGGKTRFLLLQASSIRDADCGSIAALPWQGHTASRTAPAHGAMQGRQAVRGFPSRQAGSSCGAGRLPARNRATLREPSVSGRTSLGKRQKRVPRRWSDWTRCRTGWRHSTRLPPVGLRLTQCQSKRSAISRTPPSATMRPSSKKTARVARASAKPTSCVTRILA